MGGALVASAKTGLLLPNRALAGRSYEAFDASSERDVLDALFGTIPTTPSSEIRIEAPMQGTADSVPLTVWAELTDVELIAIVTSANPQPLCATLHTGGVSPYFRTRVRMARSGAITAYVQAAGKLYSASRPVKITAGGYGAGGR